MNNPTAPLTKQHSNIRFPQMVLVAVAYMSSAHASSIWAEASAVNTGVHLNAGVGLGLPLLGTIGIEGGLNTAWNNTSTYSLGATWREIYIPFTETRLAFGSGLEFKNNDSAWYVDAKAGATLLGNVYWQSVFRFEPRSQVFKAGLGIGIAF